jgi:hypothetical protein
MLKLIAEEKFNCSLEKIISFLTKLDNIYTKYCPEEHLKCTYLKGTPTEDGSIIYFKEYIAGKKYKMRYKVQVITDHTEEKLYILHARFPRSLLKIKARFHLTKVGNGVNFKRSITVGKESTDKKTRMDRLIIRLLGKSYYESMILQNQEDLQKLKDYIENTP